MYLFVEISLTLASEYTQKRMLQALYPVQSLQLPIVVVGHVQEIRETDVSVCHFHSVPLNDRVSRFPVSSTDYPLGASASNPLPSHLQCSLTTRRPSICMD